MVLFSEITDDIHVALEFAAETNRYRKLVVDSRYSMNHAEWKFWCSGELFIDSC